MAVTILERPEGFVLDPTDIAYEVNFNPGDPDALFGSALHGLTDGDVVYIKAHVEEYAGFFVVDVFDVNAFWIIGEDGAKVPYISDDDGYYNNSSLTHGWSCVHLPITYRISNDLYPVNSVDTARTILTLSDDLGYARVTLSGSLGTFEDLSFVKISSSANSDFDGVYQVFDKISTTDITLSVAYSTFNGAGLLGATIQLYYGNYNVVVQVYAGITASHEWTLQKPYELAATLELIPDSDNEVTFSINEILKAYVKSVNNLLLGTMPNNIDAWTNFYISIAEQYDTSNGYTVSTNLSSFTSDQSTFEGTAVNAVLPFKNIHSGNLSEYLMTNSEAKFLTLFERPLLFSCGDDTPNCYNDISWIKIDDLPVTVKKEFYSDGVLSLTETESNDEDYGVIRTEIEANCSYDRMDITLQVENTVGTSSIVRNTPGSTVTSFDFFIPAGTTPPGDYSYTVTISSGVTGGDIAIATLFYLYFDGTSDTIVSISRTTVGTTTASGVAFPIPEKSVIGIQLVATINDNAPAGLVAAVNVSFDIDESTTVISETKQFDVDCGCADQEMRLTWLNYLGGFDHWVFKAETGHAIDITSTKETTKNIFPEWPKSYGEFSDTIRKQTSRESVNRIFLTTQYLTEDQADAVAYIKTSPLVQIINSRSDRRTLIIDSDSFTKYTDNQKLITISFSARYTDNIGSQKV